MVDGPLFPPIEEVAWTVDELERQAQLELQRQLRSRDPKIKRDAAREMLDMVQEHRRRQSADQPAEIVYVTAAANDYDLDELLAEYLRQAPDRERLLLTG